jgi:hypothetical protein
MKIPTKSPFFKISVSFPIKFVLSRRVKIFFLETLLKKTPYLIGKFVKNDLIKNTV